MSEIRITVGHAVALSACTNNFASFVHNVIPKKHMVLLLSEYVKVGIYCSLR